jgi:hypothetical protein
LDRSFIVQETIIFMTQSLADLMGGIFNPMRRKTSPEQAGNTLNPKNELFCRYYTQNSELFGNATHAYAEAFDYKLDTLSQKPVYSDPDEDGNTEKIEDSEYDRACHVCAVEASRLLRKPEIQARITVFLNELLKDEIVDSQLAKLITQDADNTAKIAAVREYNKLRGRIIDKTQQVSRLPFGETDLSAVIAALPQERQDYFYEIIKGLIEEAELLRSTATAQGGGTR